MFSSKKVPKTFTKESEISALGFDSEPDSILQPNTTLTLQEEKRLKQVGATVRNASSYMERLKIGKEREMVAKNLMEKMSIGQLTELLSCYHIMAQICSEVLEKKLTIC